MAAVSGMVKPIFAPLIAGASLLIEPGRMFFYRRDKAERNAAALNFVFSILLLLATALYGYLAIHTLPIAASAALFITAMVVSTTAHVAQAAQPAVKKQSRSLSF